VKILYCNSYQSFYLALNWFLKGDSVELWSAKGQILTTAKRIGIPTRELPYFKPSWWIFRPSHMKFFFEQLSLSLSHGCELHFTHTQWDTFLFRLIPFIRSRKHQIKICLWDVEYSYPLLKAGFNYLGARLEHLVSEAFFPSNMILKEFKGKAVFGIDPLYCESWRVEILEIQYDYWDMVVETCQKVKLDLERVNWLFLEQPDLLVEREEEFYLIEQILELGCMVKPHPASQRSGWGTKIYGEEYPFELLLMKINKGVIGMFSIGLIYAAKHGIMSISLLHIVDEHLSKKQRKHTKLLKEELARQSNGKIMFPKDWNELLKLIQQ
jgi:hypothetical protein